MTEPEDERRMVIGVTLPAAADHQALADVVATLAFRWEEGAGPTADGVFVFTAPAEEYAAREIDTPEVRQAITDALYDTLRDMFGDPYPHEAAGQLAGAVFVILDRASAGQPLEGS